MSRRQTFSYLQRRFDAMGLRPLTRYGQNFLVDLNILDLIARSAHLTSQDVVLEIGTGTGSLTTRLAESAGAVVTVEVDTNLAELAKQETAEFNNVTLLQQDALRNKNNLSDIVMDTVRTRMASIPNSRLKLVANLPYNVATPIISNLLESDPWPSRIVCTIQKELAERIVAPPRSKDYSALSIWIQSQCESQIVRVLPPSVFWPRPKVESAILDIVPNPAKRDRITDTAFYHTFVRSLFFHRRKFLRSVLQSATKELNDKALVDQVLAEMKLDPSSRAEELTVDQTILLADRFRPIPEASKEIVE